MKTMKKAMALVLAMIMCFTLSVSVFATENIQKHTVTITNKDTTTQAHTYEAYQIFKGVYDASTKKLSDVDWGNNIDTTKGTFTFKEKTYALNNKDDAATLADDLAEYSNDDSDIQEFAAVIASYIVGDAAGNATSDDNGVATITNLEDGYYFIKDADDSLDEATNAAYTRYILQVLGDESVEAKADVPTVEKKVQDINDSEDTEAGDPQDSADYDIGDDVPFTLTGTLPSNYDSYETYKYVFHDTLSNGLIYNSDAKVYVVNGEGEEETETEITSSATIEPPTTGSEKATLTITLANLKEISEVTKESKIVVRYTAELGTDAVIGGEGNENTVYLEFSNDPNHTGEGTPTGNTPEDKVIVFTYKVIANKVMQDENGEYKPLSGAKFALYKLNAETGEYDLIKELSAGAGESFAFEGIDDGTYKLVETKTPAGYNTIKDQIFKVTVNHDIESADPTISGLNGETIENGIITFTPNDDAGSLTTDVLNKAGATLPSTGGIGTTIFYIIGGILVVGAAVLLVTKKRMSKEA